MKKRGALLILRSITRVCGRRENVSKAFEIVVGSCGLVSPFRLVSPKGFLWVFLVMYVRRRFSVWLDKVIAVLPILVI
jgi:hypothetical protein